jgi:hypothetical protein
MDNTILQHRRLVVFALAVALALAVVVVLPKASSAAPPEPYDVTFEATGFCDFPVLVETTGKSKTIALPDGSFLTTAPGQRVTLTNLEEPDKQASFVITGTVRQTELENGSTLVVARGRNNIGILGEGIFITIGRVEFIVTPIAGSDFVDINILENQGRLIDVCPLLT